MSELALRELRRGDEARWDAFVRATPGATFFHLSGWRRVIEDAFGHRTHFLIAERADEILGVLPLAEVRSTVFGHSLVSLPFCVYGGIAAIDAEAARALDSRAQALARDLGVGHLEYRHMDCFNADWPSTELYVTFRRAILPEVEANMLAIPRKQRAMVRKGIRNGLASEVDDGIDRFFGLYADNVHRHGTPALPHRYFDLLREVFGRDCEIRIVVHRGRPVSGVLSFYFRDVVLPYYAGDTPEARDLAANDFKYWELMARACERGYRTFDFGRSKRGTGSFDFKKNWGFDPTPLHYEYQLVRSRSLPRNNPANPKYRLFIAAWRRLPRSVANALGPHIVRSLG